MVSITYNSEIRHTVAVSSWTNNKSSQCDAWKDSLLLGEIYKSSGHGPGQRALGGPAWGGGLDQGTSRDAFQLHLFCDARLNAECHNNAIMNPYLYDIFMILMN